MRLKGLRLRSFLLWGGLGAPFQHRVPKSQSRSSKMSPNMVENHRKVTSKSSKISKKTPEYGYQVLLKKSKHKFGGHSPCISYLFGARNLGRVLAALPYFAFSVATFFPHSDGAKPLRFVGSSIRARWRDLRSNWIKLVHHYDLHS